MVLEVITLSDEQRELFRGSPEIKRSFKKDYKIADKLAKLAESIFTPEQNEVCRRFRSGEEGLVINITNLPMPDAMPKSPMEMGILEELVYNFLSAGQLDFMPNRSTGHAIMAHCGVPIRKTEELVDYIVPDYLSFFHNDRNDLQAIFGYRGIAGARTHFLDMRKVIEGLSSDDISELRKPQFSYVGMENTPFSMLSETSDDQTAEIDSRIRLTKTKFRGEDFMVGISPSAQEVLTKFAGLMLQNIFSVELRAGTMVMYDNTQIEVQIGNDTLLAGLLHSGSGRSEYKAEEEPSKRRWVVSELVAKPGRNDKTGRSI